MVKPYEPCGNECKRVQSVERDMGLSPMFWGQCSAVSTALFNVGSPAPQPFAPMFALRNRSAHADQLTSISMSLFFGRWMTMQAKGQVKVSTHGPPTTRQRTWS